MNTSTLPILKFLVVCSLSLPARSMSSRDLPVHFDNSVHTGKALFGQYCSKCHGADGTKGKFGAKNLQKSTLTEEQYFKTIQKGKGIMPSWEKKLTTDQILDILTFIKTLKE